MLKMISVFVMVFGIVFFGLWFFSTLAKEERWDLLKLLTYSGVCAIIATVILTLIVILF